MPHHDQGAEFTGNADYDSPRGCAWRCADGWQLTPLGVCAGCRDSPSFGEQECESGFSGVTCVGGGYYCQACFLSASSLPPLGAYETWGVNCGPTCAAGAYNDTEVAQTPSLAHSLAPL